MSKFTRIAGFSLPEVINQNYDAAGKTLLNVSQINLLVGANNSGKSRFLRFLAAGLKNQRATALVGMPVDRRNLIHEVASQIESLRNQFGGDTFGVLQNTAVARFCDPDEVFSLKEVAHFLEQASDTLGLGAAGIYPGGMQMRGTDRQKRVDAAAPLINALAVLKDSGVVPPVPWRKVYLPTLRGLRPVSPSGDPYLERTMKDYFASEDMQQVSVFTGVELFATLRSKLLGDHASREMVREFENYLDDRFFESQGVTLTPREKDVEGSANDTVWISLGDRKDLPMWSVGDGLQTLIILAWSIFSAEEGTLFFVEEPETHTHPGLQRALLDLMRENDQHQYFLTTHSNHLLDLTFDSSDTTVFLFQHPERGSPNPRHRIEAVSPRDRRILASLGAYSSSVLRCNATLWVEGITDRLYLRAYLERFLGDTKERPREDVHYAFVEYQGACIKHWDFAENGERSDRRILARSIASGAFVVADGDTEKWRGFKEELDMSLGQKLHVLDCKEIENLLPESVVRAVVSGRLSRMALRPGPLANAKAFCGKIELRSYGRSKEGLGTYLDGLLQLDGKFADPSGTVKRKLAFCEEALDWMRSNPGEWQLTPAALKLCTELTEHIRASNPGRLKRSDTARLELNVVE